MSNPTQVPGMTGNTSLYRDTCTDEQCTGKRSLAMSGMESTLLRTAENEGHVCPRGVVEEQNYSGGAEGTPRVLEVV